MNQLKEHKSFAEQVQILKQREMLIEDEKKAEDYLSRRNYYRLNVYFHEFQKKNPKTKCPTYDRKVSFEDIKAIEECDSCFRHLIFRYIEMIELKLRTMISYRSSELFGPDVFDNGNCFDDQNHLLIGNVQYSFRDLGVSVFSQQVSLILRPFSPTVCQKMLAASAQGLTDKDKRDILQLRKKYPVEYHHVLNYGSKFPAWVLIEFLSFGDLSKVYRYLKSSIQEEIGKCFNIYGSQLNYQHQQASKSYNSHGKQKQNEFFLSSWFHCLSTVRNICAHHGYLFRRKLDIAPSKKNDYFTIYQQSFTSKKKLEGYVFDAVICIYSILADDERKSFVKDFEAFISCFQRRKTTSYKIKLSDYGIPNNWKQIFQAIDAEIVRARPAVV